MAKREKTLKKEALAVKKNRDAELRRLLTKRRMMGMVIDEEFAAVLDEQHGIRNDANERYTVRSLKNIFTRYMKGCAEDTRENFQGYQELQKQRLEYLLSLVMKEIDPDKSSDREHEYVLTHKAFLGYIKEARSLVAELSTLTGANAPIELLVSGQIKKEVTLIHEVLEKNLPEDVFSQVAAVLTHALGISDERLGEVERERKQLVETLDAQIVELLDE